MTEVNELGLVKIRRALISVSDKTGIVEFARELKRFGVEIISTGGTANTLREAGIEVRDVSDVTGFPEMMDGRIKTLHPKIHGALLALRDNPEHQAAMDNHEIEPIDMVVVNLYPFEQSIAREDVTLAEGIEQIDIGGPAMIRSAAKNHRDVAVVVDPDNYDSIVTELVQQDGELALDTRAQLALLAFARTAAYDNAIFGFLQKEQKLARGIDNDPLLSQLLSSFNERINFSMLKMNELRYGENPHQKGALYFFDEPARDQDGVALAELLSGKEMSFNNYVDADAAWQLVSDFDQLACAIIKHTNPAGVASGATAEEAYRRALACDPLSAFGGIVDLLFAWTVCKHTKSNAIVYARGKQTVGVGAGQMSRVDSVKLGAMRAQLPVKGSVLASDAFFPFRDGIDEAAKHGITAVIQPGGSVRDEEVIAAADEEGLAMVFTGVRHFKH